MSCFNHAARPGRPAWLVDAACILFLIVFMAHLWVASRIPTGDLPSDTFPGCQARMLDLYFSTGRGRVHCFGDEWWTGLDETLANAFGAHSPPPIFGVHKARGTT